MNKQAIWKAVGCLFLLPGVAIAHTGVGETAGFIHGLSHPISGADHMLAMMAVGLWAAQIGGRALWVVPGTFVIVMILGGALGFSAIPVPFIEAGILVSLLVLGILIAGAFRLPVVYSAMIVGIFALFHGHAHGAEMPVAVGAVSYSVGFALSTALLHAVGIASGIGFQKLQPEKISRLAGGAIALAGIYLAVT